MRKAAINALCKGELINDRLNDEEMISDEHIR